MPCMANFCDKGTPVQCFAATLPALRKAPEHEGFVFRVSHAMTFAFRQLDGPCDLQAKSSVR